jgi:hypothetical protein
LRKVFCTVQCTGNAQIPGKKHTLLLLEELLFSHFSSPSPPLPSPLLSSPLLSSPLLFPSPLSFSLLSTLSFLSSS